MNPDGPGDGPASAEADGEARITLLTRVGCHLCDTARDAIIRVARREGVGWREVDVDSAPHLAEEYGDRVPVTLVDGREHGYWRVEEERLRRALAGSRWSLWSPGRH
ncbi:putative redoxin [Frankia sp. AiPs1]|uniref:glutaredoxin family protein n=1 Tax=Frankia sp. AiPa1 TaxID=573492 RepID=UPI00202B2089|nr:glutaredoxin family protein [Frankia sp. AiPa1]MCL9759321.1 glutaredoxin family protein [Frankia sp. AiPa1]